MFFFSFLPYPLYEFSRITPLELILVQAIFLQIKYFIKSLINKQVIKASRKIINYITTSSY